MQFSRIVTPPHTLEFLSILNKKISFSPSHCQIVSIAHLFFFEEGAYCFANVVGQSVCLSVDKMVSDHFLKNFNYHRALILHMLIGYCEDMTPIDFEFIRSTGHL